MSYDYLPAQTEATALIQEYGTQVTLVSGTGSRTSTYAVFSAADKMERDKSNVVSSGTTCVVSGALKTAPQVDDTIVRGAEEYRIVDVLVVKPADTIVVFKLTVKR